LADLTRRGVLFAAGAVALLGQTTTRILFGGDVMLSRFVGTLARQKKDAAWPLRDIAPVLMAADIAFVNLESPFSDKGKTVESGMLFKAEPEMIAGLELAGIDIVSTANNHARDRDAYGVEFTLDLLSKHGIVAVGTAKNADDVHKGAVLSRNGVRFGFLAYTYDQANGNRTDKDDRVAMMDVAQMKRDVASMKMRADVAIVSMHAGTEYSAKPNAQQKEFAHAAVDAGAAVVVGHHPHVQQPWEEYGGGAIFYSLGNLVFDQFQRAETQKGALAEVVFTGKSLTHAGVLPVDIVRTVPRLAVPKNSTPTAGTAASGASSRKKE
jgi:poly-gamma-glutamate capsule biosynthesis protein CapA/YwtB (metallophosphatase superfamily)